ncbi:MAG TPA: alpha/beta-hydrolase family protein [Actinomycetota bacterium]|nr:alpha/beta-hydrolase family protein [Actinomycetota bacterium]
MTEPAVRPQPSRGGDGFERWRRRLIRVAQYVNPVGGNPTAAVEAMAALDSFGPSLMPRSSVHQGVVTGLASLGARAAGRLNQRIIDSGVPEGAGLRGRLLVRGAVAAGATVLSRLPEDRDESTARASIRAIGWWLAAGAVGGTVFDLAEVARRRFPSQRAIRPIAVTAAGSAGLAFWLQRRLASRQRAIEPGPKPSRNTLPASVGTAVLVLTGGTAVGRTFLRSRRGLERFFGPGRIRHGIGRTVNAAAWAGAGTAAYLAGVSAIGRANEKVEPGYSTPPTSALLSGSPESFSPLEDLGLHGRRYVTDTLGPELIERVMGEPARAEPIRVFVGFNSEPLYSTGRAELALEELARTGAFDRSNLLLVSPTGTGWVDHTMIETAEFLTRGDIATCCIQYGRYPSFLSLQKLALGRGQFRTLLWGVSQRLADRPPERRPRILVFGESLGAWSASDVVMHLGIAGFDHYGIDRALWVGLPWMAKWSRSGMSRGASELVPPGTVRTVDRPDQLVALSDEERKRLRAVILSHDNDPIALFGPDLLVRRPEWLGPNRGRGVPQGAHWSPITTFLQTAIDAANAMTVVPGEFRSSGHDYRADMAQAVRYAYDLDATAEQMAAIEETLRRLERERAERIKATSQEAAPEPPTGRDQEEVLIRGGVALRERRTRGARWLSGRLRASRGVPGHPARGAAVR